MPSWIPKKMSQPKSYNKKNVKIDMNSNKIFLFVKRSLSGVSITIDILVYWGLERLFNFFENLQRKFIYYLLNKILISIKDSNSPLYKINVQILTKCVIF